MLLTWVGYAKPGGLGHDISTGIRSSLKAVAVWIRWKKVSQCEDVTYQPNYHDGHDDLNKSQSRVQH